jgi:hypothetical protein
MNVYRRAKILFLSIGIHGTPIGAENVAVRVEVQESPKVWTEMTAPGSKAFLGKKRACRPLTGKPKPLSSQQQAANSSEE